MSNQLDQKS
jgi:hypothetical protein